MSPPSGILAASIALHAHAHFTAVRFWRLVVPGHVDDKNFPRLGIAPREGRKLGGGGGGGEFCNNGYEVYGRVNRRVFCHLYCLHSLLRFSSPR